MFKALKEWIFIHLQTNKRRKIAKRLKAAMEANYMNFPKVKKECV